MGTKTGTPGFDIDGKSYTYDVGDPNAPPDPNYPLQTDNGDMTVEQNDPPRKDLSKVTKKTLADYLGKKTAVNYYPVDATANPGSITVEGGTPVIPADEQTTGNAKHFPLPKVESGKATYRGTTDITPDLKGWMNSPAHGDVRPYSPPDASTAKLRKGKEATKGGTITGNELLPQVKKGDLGTLKNYTSAVLKNNRFTDANTYAPVDLTNPPEDYNPTFHSPKYGEISAGRLAQVGVSLSIRASRELNSAAGGSNPSSGGQEAKAILPSFNQMGASKVDVVLLQAHDVLDGLTSSEIPGGNYISIGGDSWGSLNNALDTYSGLTSLGMIALSTALTAGVTLLFKGLGFILSLVKGSPEPRKNPDGRFILGRSTVTKQADPNAFPPGLPPDIGAMLGLRSTIKPFSSALNAGIYAFFGISDEGGILGIVTSGLKSAASAPGYNSVVARAIIRSITVIIDSIKKVFKSSNLISGVKNLLSMIETLRASKLISALNIFATLGDAVLTENPDDVVDGRKEEPIRKSRVDKIGDNVPGAAAKKSRLGNGTKLKLAWASNRAPSLYLLPNAIAGLQPVAQSLGAFQSGLGLQEADTRSFYRLLSDDDAKTNGNRIPVGDSGDAPDAVTLKKIEAVLDGSEYIPFYFHDVRTNEVIAFHAFLASLTDDFTANYDSTEGFGRVEPVKIYKGTNRKIGLSFYIVSTSPSDFNDMWVKINKLVTLVYPQYTEGRRLTDEKAKYNFIQPFSQMMGASPLIRIKLGDLFASNYSRFALARLFGATLKGAQFGGEKLKLDGSKIKDLQSKVNDAILTGDKKYKWLISGGTTLDVKQESSGLSVSAPVGGNKGGSKYATHWATDNNAAYIPVSIEKVDDDGIVYVKPEIPDAAFLSDQGITDAGVQATIIENIKTVHDNEDDPKRRIIGGVYGANPIFMKPTRKTATTIFNDAFADENQAVQDLTTFLDIEKNAIVKSFRSAGGKGLAGFIESMNFDWYDKTMWGTDPGSRAPLMCKVTIAFSPIHDITPGLDSQGYNRAPVYPIGFHAHGNDLDKKQG